MSRCIPPVRTWRVTYYTGKAVIARIDVQAPTKFLARLAVRDDPRPRRIPHGVADRVTYGLARAAR